MTSSLNSLICYGKEGALFTSGVATTVLTAYFAVNRYEESSFSFKLDRLRFKGKMDIISSIFNTCAWSYLGKNSAALAAIILGVNISTQHALDYDLCLSNKVISAIATLSSLSVIYAIHQHVGDMLITKNNKAMANCLVLLTAQSIAYLLAKRMRAVDGFFSESLDLSLNSGGLISRGTPKEKKAKKSGGGTSSNVK